MNKASAIRIAAAVSAAAASTVAGISIWSASHASARESAASMRHTAGASSRAAAYRRQGGRVLHTTGGGGPPPGGGCGNPAIGYIGTVRSGQAAGAQQALGPEMLAQVSDSALGAVDLARTPGTMTGSQQSAYFSQWEPVLARSQQSQLNSCDMLLSDRTAAQPLISSAENAVAQDGLASSASDLQSQLQEVLISDNPLAAGSVIVTLMVTGAAYSNPAPGGPALHHMAAYTVIENESSAQATAVASGGF